jgi:hypothetical protein
VAIEWSQVESAASPEPVERPNAFTNVSWTKSRQIGAAAHPVRQAEDLIDVRVVDLPFRA